MRAFNYEPLSPILFLKRSAQAFAKKIAIIENDLQKTYEEFFIECLSLAKGLQKIGVQSGNKVAYLSNNNYYMLKAFYSIPMCGAVLVPVNIRLSLKEIKFILDDSESIALVVEKNLFTPNLLSYVKNVILISDSVDQITEKVANKKNKLFSYNEIIELGTKNSEFTEYELIDENSTITLNYTSGTTGKPKGVEYTYRSTYLNSLGECLQTQLSIKSRYLWILPMFHCNGWCFTWAVTAVGATHVFLKAIDIEKIIDLILKQKITHLCAAPTVLNMISNHQNFFQLFNHNNLTIITAGASPSSRMIESYENLGVNLIHVYGLTETYGPHTVCQEQIEWNNLDKKDIALLKRMQGLPSLHSVFIRVVDKNFQDVPNDGETLGEIIMRGNNVMKGYYKAQQNHDSVKNGWFCSGDLAVVNSEGYIYIKDRLKDLIVSGGENISSIEVENILYENDEVLAAAVIATYDELWGEIVHAIVELKGNKEVTEENLIHFCKTKLASYKCPKRITFAIIPTNVNGKIQKSLLKEKYYFS